MKWVPNKSINHNRVQDLLQESLACNQFTNGGPLTTKLESLIHSSLELDSSKSVVCVSNGTVALWAVAAALEIFHSETLKTPLRFATQSFTFPASAQGFLSNAIIVDIDIDGGPDLSSFDPNSIDALIITNVFGNVVDIQKYQSWADSHKKFLIFDNAATSFTCYNGKNSCLYGNASTISFHHTKPIGFGEGGAVIIDSIYEKSLRNVINFGIDNTSPSTACWNRKSGNYKMSDIQAAYIYQFIESNSILMIKSHIQSLYSHFKNSIASFSPKDAGGLQPTCSSFRMFPNFSSEIPFVSCLSIFSPHSNLIIDELLYNNIYCRKYYKPLLPLKNSNIFYDNIICISCNTDMTIEDINKIISILQKYGSC